jgi:hypothetical protein
MYDSSSPYDKWEEKKKLLNSIVDPCKKCKHAKCICEISDDALNTGSQGEIRDMMYKLGYLRKPSWGGRGEVDGRK